MIESDDIDAYYYVILPHDKSKITFSDVFFSHKSNDLALPFIHYRYIDYWDIASIHCVMDLMTRKERMIVSTGDGIRNLRHSLSTWPPEVDWNGKQEIQSVDRDVCLFAFDGNRIIGSVDCLMLDKRLYHIPTAGIMVAPGPPCVIIQVSIYLDLDIKCPVECISQSIADARREFWREYHLCGGTDTLRYMNIMTREEGELRCDYCAIRYGSLTTYISTEPTLRENDCKTQDWWQRNIAQ